MHPLRTCRVFWSCFYKKGAISVCVNLHRLIDIYFYVLRPILACRWILEKQTPPPMLFSELADACLDKALVPAVTNLLKMKMETPEIGLGPRIDVINDYLDSMIEEIDQQIQMMPCDEKVTWEELNQLFLKTVSLDEK